MINFNNWDPLIDGKNFRLVSSFLSELKRDTKLLAQICKVVSH